MNRYCEGTLGGICRFAESLRPGSNQRYLHSMDIYVIGEPTSVRIALMMFHNNHYHHVSIAVQATQFERLMAARAQAHNIPNTHRPIVEGVIVIMREIESDPIKHFEMMQASINW
ncbi:unnamed protein product [Caenorhabditis brenneri]